MTSCSRALVLLLRKYYALMLSQSGSGPEEMMRQMSIPDLVQKLQVAESTFGQVHPQVCTPTVDADDRNTLPTTMQFAHLVALIGLWKWRKPIAGSRPHEARRDSNPVSNLTHARFIGWVLLHCTRFLRQNTWN